MRTVKLSAPGLAALFGLILAGCGNPQLDGPAAPSMPRMAEGEKATQLHVSASAAPGIPRGFGDVKPHEWGAISPANYQVHGIDASRYQGEIDFFAARQSGIRFAWLKATEGGDHLDPGYAINAPRARAAGVPVGAYHFYYFCRTPEEQAAWFIQNVGRVAGDLPPVLDMEWNHQSRTCSARPGGADVRDQIERFTAIVGRHYGTRPVIYTTPDFYKDNDLGQMRGQEFWLRAVTKHPSEGYPDERWSFWQYSGTGIVPGVAGKVDLNAFGGSFEGWQSWLLARRQ